ncbi:MAG TPA: response regulator, partial [Segetibacter sp.]
NKGSKFTVCIPITPKETEQKRPANAGSATISLPAVIDEQTKIIDDRKNVMPGDKVMLIIEDDALFASVINEFAKANGYKTIVALSGDEGWFFAKKVRPAAIILDLYLPVFDGQTLLKIFKEDKDLKHIPVHIISAISGTEEIPAGAIAFLTKPVAKEDLERAFKLITDSLLSAIKKVLIVSTENLKNEIDVIFPKKQDVVFDVADSVENATICLKKIKYDCVIVDIGNNIKEGISRLNILNDELRPHNIPTIIYLDNDITTANELELKRIGDVIVRKSSLSNKRLIDELELFLYKVEENNSPTAFKLNNTGGDVTLKNKKVLLVDDDMRNIFALSAALEQEKIKVITANNGQEALDVLASDKNIDIVLMDIMMPEMDGYEAMSYIRKEMKLSKLPIIALTAKAMAGDRDKCIEAGASDYISKPVDMQKLISLMRVWLS